MISTSNPYSNQNAAHILLGWRVVQFRGKCLNMLSCSMAILAYFKHTVFHSFCLNHFLIPPEEKMGRRVSPSHASILILSVPDLQEYKAA